MVNTAMKIFSVLTLNKNIGSDVFFEMESFSYKSNLYEISTKWTILLQIRVPDSLSVTWLLA